MKVIKKPTTGQRSERKKRKEVLKEEEALRVQTNYVSFCPAP
jgi:hypothetical protein